MLQQTQVATVIPYYERFLRRFPDVHHLAAANLDDVLALWAGLGYYTRARQAHRCAQLISGEFAGVFPSSAAELKALPGIGPSTAAAIAAFCHSERVAILDGNVKRVLARHAAIRSPLEGSLATAQLWALAQERLPAAVHMPAYTQAIMDLGATVCRRGEPLCQACPVSAGCAAAAQGIARELPVRLKRPGKPVRQAHWLVVLDKGQVWLEKRPPEGLWGGLLALPQFPDPASLHAHLRERFPQEAMGVHVLPPRRHAFTHFTLDFTAHVVTAEAPAADPVAMTSAPYPLARLEDLALPAPVVRLLEELRSDAGAVTGA